MRPGATEQNVTRGGSAAEVQSLNGVGGLKLLFSIFDKKGTPFIYLPLKNGTQYNTNT